MTAVSLQLAQGPNFGIDPITNPVFAGIITITITTASIKLYALPRSASHFQGSPNTGPFCGAVAPRPLWRLAPVIGPSPAKRETSGVSKSHRTHRILMARSLVVWPPQLRSNTGKLTLFVPKYSCRKRSETSRNTGSIRLADGGMLVLMQGRCWQCELGLETSTCKKKHQ